MTTWLHYLDPNKHPQSRMMHLASRDDCYPNTKEGFSLCGLPIELESEDIFDIDNIDHVYTCHGCINRYMKYNQDLR